ncbi:hypothetical protein D1BOALGB6SA_6061 [Olavius sp. associated proteobacterium Delta 1]|nr:hypothetical protein D1BOALGB6SA_6061 [Olavius sp. associated proteobacterium Delta 1]
MYSVYFIENMLSEAKPPFDIRYSAVLRFAFIFFVFDTRKLIRRRRINSKPEKGR